MSATVDQTKAVTSDGATNTPPPKTLTTTIEPATDSPNGITSTTVSSGGSTSSNPNMFSTGEQTVIKALQETLSKSATSAGQEQPPTEEVISEIAAKHGIEIESIPPLVLDMINRAYVGLNFYDQVREDAETANYDYLSQMLRDVEKQDPEHGEDHETWIAKKATEYIGELEERNREVKVLREEVGFKLGALNEMLESRIEQQRAKLASIKLNKSEDEIEEAKKNDSNK